MNEFESLKNELARFVQRLEHWPGGAADSQLPAGQIKQIRELAAAVRTKVQAAGEKSGIIALFTGPSGTGKTLAAQALAHEIGSEVLKVDLNQVVSKYIGETEKNLTALFGAAETGASILFFDEADSLFGKRTEVKDSHDRYANLEAGEFLRQAGAYPGLVILACEKPVGPLGAIQHKLDFSTSVYPCD